MIDEAMMLDQARTEISEKHSLLRSNLNVATSVFHNRLRLE